MKRMSKVLSLILATTLLLNLAACGGTSNGNSNTSANPATAASNGDLSSGDGGATQLADYDILPELDTSVDYTQGDNLSFIIATDGAEDRVDGLLVHYIADQLEAITGGRIKMQMYFNGSMGTDTELCESAQAGDVTFFLGSTAFTANFVTDLSVIDLPFLYKNVQHFRDTMDDPEIVGYYSQRYSENGFELIGFFDQGMRQMTTNVRVQAAADLHNQKIRVMENPLHISIWKALGANPTPMAFSEVYMALQQGTIDAQENPFEVIYANRLYEQQDYVVLTNHLPASHNLLISQIVYNSLSDSDKDLVMAVGKAAIAYSRIQCDQRLSERIKLVEDTGTEVLELPSDVLQEMREKCTSVYSEVRTNFGDSLTDMQINGAGRYA